MSVETVDPYLNQRDLESKDNSTSKTTVRLIQRHVIILSSGSLTRLNEGDTCYNSLIKMNLLRLYNLLGQALLKTNNYI